MISRFLIALFMALYSIQTLAEETKFIDTGIFDEVYFIKTKSNIEKKFEIVGLGRKTLSEKPTLVTTWVNDGNCAKFGSIVMEKPEVYTLLVDHGFTGDIHCGLIKNRHLDKLAQ